MSRGDLFGRSSRHARQFEKGDIKYVVLNLLKDRPSYGYEIIRALEDHFGGLYTPSAGAVYPTLQLLEDLGYVTAEQRDGRKVHTITEAGRQFLAERQEQVDEIKGRMRGWRDRSASRALRDTLDEFGHLKKLLGREARHMEPAKLQRIRDVIVRANQDIETILKE